MKRNISLALLAVLALGSISLAAQAPSFPELKGKTVELNLWTHEDANRTPLEKGYIAEFMAANPGVTVNYSTYPSGAKIREVVTTAFASGQGPDIFNLELQDEYPFMANGRVAPVDYKMVGVKGLKDLEDNYQAGMIAPVIENGQAYGMPLELTNWCLYLNKKIFRDAGLDPDKDWPKTWEDVMSVSEKLVLRNGQIITRRGFDFRYGFNLISVMPMVEQLGGELISKDGKAIVGDAAWLKVLSYFRDFGPGGKNLGSPTYTTARSLFDNDKNEVALSLSGLYQEARMKKANPAFFASKDWMVIPYPQWKDAKKRVPDNFYGHYYMVNAQSSKLEQQAAWALVGYMLSHGEEYLSKVAIVQPTKALFESKTFKEMPYSDVFTKDLAAGHMVYYGASSSKIDSLLKEAFESVMISGGSDPQKALDKLRQGVTAVLAEE
jgi:multiple sugar transport system substrate-binding protein